MSRVVTTDFKEVIGFLNSYSISSSTSNPEFIKLISQCHKRYFALMIFGAELFEHQPGSNNSSATKRNTAIFNRNIYLQEFISDMGGALFNWSHGAYKSAKLLLRSSLENLMKGLSFLEQPGIATMTSVYQVFDTAAKTIVFSGSLEAAIFGRLRQFYGILCADAHGASLAHMQQTKSLNYFPTFDLNLANSSATIFCKIAQEALNILCLTFKPILIGMHYANFDVISPLLTKAVKRRLHAID